MNGPVLGLDVASMFSVADMTVTMIDSAAGMRAMVSSSPEQWKDAARSLWEPMTGMYFFIPGGPDLAAVHTQNFGFSPFRSSRKEPGRG